MLDDVRMRAPFARRRFLTGIAGLAATPLLPVRSSAQATPQSSLVEARLIAESASAQLVPSEYPSTAVWAYNGTVPGPMLRLRQGDRLRVRGEPS